MTIDAKATSRIDDIGLFLALFPCVNFILVSLGFIFGIKIGPLSLVLAFVASLLFVFLFSGKKSWISFMYLLPVSVFICFAAGFISSRFYDITYDGQWYHSEAVLALKNGWNPFKGYYYSSFPHSKEYPIWVNHYPNASGYFKASVFAFTGFFESVKAVNILVMISSGILVFGTLNQLSRPSFFVKIWIAFLLAANPIAFGELFSNYVDGQMYSYILIIGCLLIRAIQQPKYLLAALVCTVYLTNLKYTGLIYISVFMMGFLGYILLHKQIGRFFKYSLFIGIALVFATCLFGYPTYVKNTIHKGHPLYPLMGKEKKDVAKILYPADFFGKNRFEKFFLSNFGQPAYTRAPSCSVQRKPFIEFNLKYVGDYQSMVSETSGFGPANAEIFFTWLLSFPFVIVLAYRSKFHRALLFLLGVILLSVFINPDAWLARYAPQFYLCLPLIAFGLVSVSKKLYQGTGWLLIVVLTLNIGLIAGLYLPAQIRYTHEINSTFEKLRNIENVRVFFSFIVSHRQRLKESKIEFKEADGYLVETFAPFPNMLGATYYSVDSTETKKGPE